LSATVRAVLVTGGAGFVGAYLVRDLLARGDSVVVYDEHPANNVLASVLPGRTQNAARVVEGSTLDIRAMAELCEKHEVDRIVHLASPLTQAINDDPPAGIAASCIGTANVFEVARRLAIRRVVWASSIAVFGNHDSAQAGTLRDDAVHVPTNLYGSCKSLCEQLSTVYRREHDLDVIGLRLSIIYGAWRVRGLRPSFGTASDPIAQAVLGEPVVIHHPSERRNWQYVEDVASVLVRSLDAPRTIQGVFNTSGVVANFRELGTVLEELVPGADVTYDEAGSAGPTVPYEFDDSAFRHQIGYGKRHELRQGISKVVSTYAADQISGGRHLEKAHQ